MTNRTAHASSSRGQCIRLRAIAKRLLSTSAPNLVHDTASRRCSVRLCLASRAAIYSALPYSVSSEVRSRLRSCSLPSVAA
jgi:hypothetical protein